MIDKDKFVYYYQHKDFDGRGYDKQLYHYSSFKYGEEDLMQRHFKLSAPGGFNDPLDTIGWYKRYPTQQAFFKYFANMLFKDEVREMQEHGFSNKIIWKEYRQYVASAYSGIMLSRNPLSQNLMMSFCGVENDIVLDTLLWAHYAEGGKGLRIGVKFSKDDGYDIRPIKYVRKMAALDFYALTKHDPQSPEFSLMLNEYHLSMICSKHRAWKYEHEYRLVTNMEEKNILEQNDRGTWFVKIPIECVKTVDFGCRAFGDDKYKADELFIRKANFLHEKTGVPLAAFRKTEIRSGVYGYEYIPYDSVVSRFMRRYRNEEIRRQHSLSCPREVRLSTY